MKCPKCDIVLSITDRQGIEIDYCPQCRGIWLDRGELDKIIERSNAQSFGTKKKDDDDDRYRSQPHYDDRHRHDSQYGHGYKPHKKKSLLEDLFDFD